MPGPLVAAAIPAIGSVVGGIIQNNANRDMAREQMAFQERMSGTAYQRATEDMRLAGINPMLAYMQGGASSPQGATAQMSDVISPAVASAQHARRLSKELKAMDLEYGHRKLMNQYDRGVKVAEGEHLTSLAAEAKARTRLHVADLPYRKGKGEILGGAATGFKKIIHKAREIWERTQYRSPWERW